MSFRTLSIAYKTFCLLPAMDQIVKKCNQVSYFLVYGLTEIDCQNVLQQFEFQNKTPFSNILQLFHLLSDFLCIIKKNFLSHYKVVMSSLKYYIFKVKIQFSLVTMCQQKVVLGDQMCLPQTQVSTSIYILRLVWFDFQTHLT